MDMISKLGNSINSTVSNGLQNLMKPHEEIGVLAADNKTLMRMPTRRDAAKARENRLQDFKERNVIESGSSELGDYDGNPIITSDLSILERLEVNTSNHISNWKTDVFLGNGQDIVKKDINLIPTWDSKKDYMQISRVIIWIVPVAPGTKGKIKAALVDRNKAEAEQIIFQKEGVLTDPLCFIFYMHWSFLRSMNNKASCPQLKFISNEVYKKGVPFAVANFAWRKVFCNSPIAMTEMQPDLIVLNRGITIRNKALLEAVKCIVPNGNNGKTIKKQIETLSKSLEAAALEDENESSGSEMKELTFDL
nr:viral movement protein [Groundnut chlorotic fan-spot virus]